MGLSLSSFKDWVNRTVRGNGNSGNGGYSGGGGSGGGGGAWGGSYTAPSSSSGSGYSGGGSSTYDPQKAYEVRMAEQNFFDNASRGGGSSGPTQQQIEQQQKNSLMDQIREKFNSLQNVFNGIFGGIDNSAREKTSDINNQYNTNVDDLNKSYAKSTEQTDQAYGGRGLASSSYLTNAQNDNQDIYTRNLKDTMKQRDDNLANVGRYVATAKAGLDAQKNAYNDAVAKMGEYGVSDLQSLLGQVGSGLSSANQSAANYLTNSDYVNQLNAITPIKQQGTSQLASKLQSLVTSSAPIFAKREIAKGLIRAADVTDQGSQNYWQSEFERMLNGA